MSDCLFCKFANHEIPVNTIYEDDVCIAFLDLSQGGYGHTLVVPKKHFSDISTTDDEVLTHLIKVVKKITNHMFDVLPNCEGVNVLNNCKEVAGQSIMHTHIHIIPRYKNDGFNLVPPNNEGKYDLTEIQKLLKF